MSARTTGRYGLLSSCVGDESSPIELRNVREVANEILPPLAEADLGDADLGRRHSFQTFSFADPFPVRPGCELFDLARQLVGVLPDEIDE